jgi:hypothetical protein
MRILIPKVPVKVLAGVIHISTKMTLTVGRLLLFLFSCGYLFLELMLEAHSLVFQVAFPQSQYGCKQAKQGHQKQDLFCVHDSLRKWTLHHFGPVVRLNDTSRFPG